MVRVCWKAAARRETVATTGGSMLEPIVPGPAAIGNHQYIPPFLAPLISAAKRGDSLLPTVASITQHFGFDSFLYGMSTMPKLNHEGTAYVYTTQPRSWVERYDQRAYIEVDPRINLNWDSAIPLIWDQTSVRGIGAREDAFLNDALAHGIASGISFMFHGPHNSHVLLALNSPIAVSDPIRMQAILRNVPDIMMFGHYFHQIFMQGVLEKKIEPISRGASLSRRETECVRLAARGLTTEDIATKLDIRSRTVQFHFDSIRSKLGAANRQEAIAIAVRRNLL